MLTATASERTRIFQSFFSGYHGPAFSIRLWDGWQWANTADAAPRCTVVFNSPARLQALIVRPSEITLGEAFLSGAIDVEGDLFSVFAVTEHIFHSPQGLRRKLLETLSRVLFELARWWNHGSPHSLARDRSAISHHYDQPVDFFRPWLGDSLVYSCAYFRSPTDDLATAQANKLELVCRKLRLSPPDRFLDIGCGWGSLVLHAASRHHVEAQGITISQEQAAVADERIRQAQIAHSCRADLLDYRHAPDSFLAFDKIASLGMFEHVGMRTSRATSAPSTICCARAASFSTTASPAPRRPSPCPTPRSRQSRSSAAPSQTFLQQIPGLRRAQSSSFIDKYVFPDGELVTALPGPPRRRVRRLRDPRRREPARALRAHPARLGRRPAAQRRPAPATGLHRHLPHLAALHGGSAAAFHRGDIAVYQMLLSRPDHGISGLPLTREDLYQD